MTTKMITATTAGAMTLALLAPIAPADAQTIFVPGTRLPGQSATPSPGYIDKFDADVAVTYPRDLAPLVGTTLLDRSIAMGAAKLAPMVRDGDTVVGESQGGVVAQAVKDYYSRNPESAPKDVTFITYGDPSNNDGGLLTKLPVGFPGLPQYKANDETVYDTITVAREYDPFADAPDNLNPVSWINSALALQQGSHAYDPSDLDEPDNVVTETVNSKGATNTHVLVKHDGYTPIVKAMRGWKFPNGVHMVDKWHADRIDPIVKDIVDAGYNRPKVRDSVKAEPTTKAPNTVSDNKRGSTITETETVDAEVDDTPTVPQVKADADATPEAGGGTTTSPETETTEDAAA